MTPLDKRQRRTFLLAALGGSVASLLGCGGSGSDHDAKDTPPTKPRILLPAYFYDAALWNAAITARPPGHWVIANVDNGPGTLADPHFTHLFKQTVQNGHTLFGYIATGHGQINQQAVLDQAAAWKGLYGIEHIFLDEVGNNESSLAYYRALIQSLRATYPSMRIVLNPGTIPLEAYFQIDPLVDIVVFEDRWSRFQAQTFPSWLDRWWPNTHLIVYDAPIDALKTMYDFVQGKGARGFFVTDSPDAIYHEQLPSYWSLEINL